MAVNVLRQSGLTNLVLTSVSKNVLFQPTDVGRVNGLLTISQTGMSITGVIGLLKEAPVATNNGLSGDIITIPQVVLVMLSHHLEIR